jgi:UDP-N-acetylglucosamine--N-acetylmuramyl-(pentapeptide) pyrophosphoryl-undecaprenol N-acetylglucosamine transferase
VNNLIDKNIEWLVSKNLQVIWQTGKLYYDEFKKYDSLEGVQTHAFLNRMDLTYAAADFIISRAGAGSISELCIVGKPVIFIPSPNVAEDHQTKNALAVVNNNAALLLKESDLDKFPSLMETLLENQELQQVLSKNIKKLALPNATKAIVEEIVKLINK